MQPHNNNTTEYKSEAFEKKNIIIHSYINAKHIVYCQNACCTYAI